MRFASVCSGIEAASVAWLPLGWECAWVSEIAPFPSAVLAHRFPEVPNLGDFTQIGADRGPVDLLVGGTPCQSFSVAGRRAGLDDPRGVLAFEFVRLAGRLLPRWVVFENVPGLLSSDGGRDFGAFLGALGAVGYGFAYRVLDAQFFGVAQRRERVFVVGCLGDWRRAAAVLLEPSSLRGDPAPSREERSRVAASLTRGADSGGAGGYAGRRREDDENLAVAAPIPAHHGRADAEVTYIPALTSRCGDTQDDQQTGQLVFRKSRRASSSEDDETWVADGRANTLNGFDTGERDTHAIVAGLQDTRDISKRQNGSGVGGDVSYTLDGTGAQGVAFALGSHAGAADADASNRSHDSGGPVGLGVSRECAHSVRSERTQAVAFHGVRRLTPIECERLQGFPDNFTLVPYRGKPAADGPRYQALGNSMAVPVIAWLGRRIQMVEAVSRGA